MEYPFAGDKSFRHDADPIWLLAQLLSDLFVVQIDVPDQTRIFVGEVVRVGAAVLLQVHVLRGRLRCLCTDFLFLLAGRVDERVSCPLLDWFEQTVVMAPEQWTDVHKVFADLLDVLDLVYLLRVKAAAVLHVFMGHPEQLEERAVAPHGGHVQQDGFEVVLGVCQVIERRSHNAVLLRQVQFAKLLLLRPYDLSQVPRDKEETVLFQDESRSFLRGPLVAALLLQLLDKAQRRARRHFGYRLLSHNHFLQSPRMKVAGDLPEVQQFLRALLNIGHDVESACVVKLNEQN